MDAPHEVGTKGCMDRAVSRETALSDEGDSAHPHAEVALPAFLVAGVTAVHFAFVGHFEGLRREGRLEPPPDFPRHDSIFGHFHRSPLHTRE